VVTVVAVGQNDPVDPAELRFECLDQFGTVLLEGRVHEGGLSRGRLFEDIDTDVFELDRGNPVGNTADAHCVPKVRDRHE